MEEDLLSFPLRRNGRVELHTIMSAVPGPANKITDFPLFLSWANSHNFANHFVAWNPGAAKCQRKVSNVLIYELNPQEVSKITIPDVYIGVTDSTGYRLDEDLALGGFFERHFLNGQWFICFLEDSSFI